MPQIQDALKSGAVGQRVVREQATSSVSASRSINPAQHAAAAHGTLPPVAATALAQRAVLLNSLGAPLWSVSRMERRPSSEFAQHF